MPQEPSSGENTSSESTAKSRQTLRRLRQITQYVMLGLFFYLIFGTLPDANTFLPTDLFFRLDPLATLAASVAGRFLLASLLLSLITIGLTLLFGRVWCGWLCPLGTVLDIFKVRRRSDETIQRPSRWRNAKYIAVLAIVVAALFANQTLMILDPITLLTRTGATAIIRRWTWHSAPSRKRCTACPSCRGRSSGSTICCVAGYCPSNHDSSSRTSSPRWSSSPSSR